MKTSLLLLFSFIPMLFWAQDEILLTNPSFEGESMPGQLRHDPFTRSGLRGWFNCGPAQETAPDIHPGKEAPFFEVTQFPSDGNTYLGMVVRKNDSWESIGQKLQSPLQKQQTYQFSVSLARSLKYVSATVTPGEMADYFQPTILRVWGGTELCSREELLVATKKISHSDWRKYTLTFQPSEEWDHITFEAFYIPQALVPYNGNLLVDDLSPIVLLNQEQVLTDPMIEIDQPITAKDTIVLQLSDLPDPNKKPVTADDFMDLFERQKSYKELKEQFLLQHFHFVYTNWTFKEEVSRSGLRLYLMKCKDQEALQRPINDLGHLQMKASAAILAKVSKLYFKNLEDQKLTEEEEEYLENSNALFKSAFRKENMKQQLKKYIEEHLTDFQEEYSLFQ